jgi:hypothetical protein
VFAALTVGVVPCATAQIEQETDSVRLGCVWTDSTAAVHNIRDKQSQAAHRAHEIGRERIWNFARFKEKSIPALELDSFSL